jgi:hypothetical protein
MPDDRRDHDLTAAIESIATRSHTETMRLVAELGRTCWPRGIGDRTEPPALEWVRRWGPARLTAATLDCSCSQGRCSVCN